MKNKEEKKKQWNEKKKRMSRKKQENPNMSTPAEKARLRCVRASRKTASYATTCEQCSEKTTIMVEGRSLCKSCFVAEVGEVEFLMDRWRAKHPI